MSASILLTTTILATAVGAGGSAGPDAVERATTAVPASAIVPSPAAAADSTGRLQGVVLDADEGRPLAGATVTVDGASTTTDVRGAFVLPQVAAGTQVVGVSLAGYQTRSEPVHVQADTTTHIVVRLARDPIPLAPLPVTVRSGWLESNGFYERRLTGGSGHFIERSDIERRNIHAVTELLRDVSGVRRHAGYNTSIIRFNRPVRMGRTGVLQGPPPVRDEFERWLVGLPGCQPALYVDGRQRVDRVISGVGPAIDDFDFISPGDIEGIEVYVGANTPTRWPNANGCGLILIWLRRN